MSMPITGARGWLVRLDPVLDRLHRLDRDLGRQRQVPEEVADAVVFLASPRASFITGTNLIIDGALTQRVQF